MAGVRGGGWTKGREGEEQVKEERQPMWQLLLQGGGAGAERMTPQCPGALQIFSFERVKPARN